MTYESAVPVWISERLDFDMRAEVRVMLLELDFMAWASAQGLRRLSFDVPRGLLKRVLLPMHPVRWHRRAGFIIVQGVSLRPALGDHAPLDDLAALLG